MTTDDKIEANFHQHEPRIDSLARAWIDLANERKDDRRVVFHAALKVIAASLMPYTPQERAKILRGVEEMIEGLAEHYEKTMSHLIR